MCVGVCVWVGGYNAISPIYSHFTLLLVPCFAYSTKKGILLRSKGLLEALLTGFHGIDILEVRGPA